MKKRLIGISLALILILSLFLSTAAPAMADQVNEDEPVASLSWSGRITVPEGYPINPIYGHDDSNTLFSVSVELFDDGTLVGHLREKNNILGIDYQLPVLAVGFDLESDGTKIATILTSVDISETETWYFWAKFTDCREPGKETDKFERFFYYGQSWLNGWFVPSTMPPPTVYIASGNIQIHITDAYEE